ncbi:MAG: hypothetical protein KJN73_08895, partial [Acidimicrobiia bacterium]|nr:hypothetical protein [Acidimicrobiia bacterium]
MVGVRVPSHLLVETEEIVDLEVLVVAQGHSLDHGTGGGTGAPTDEYSGVRHRAVDDILHPASPTEEDASTMSRRFI